MNERDFLIQVMYPAAQAAYSVMSYPTPTLTLAPGYAMVGFISADPQQAAPAMAQANPDNQRLANETVIESSIFGLVAWNAAESSAIVAIRGTSNWQDWLADLEAPLVPDRSVPSAGLVHMGFQLVYEHIRDSILELLGAHCQGAQAIYVTGHSLGGALAVLCGLDLARNSPVKVVPEVHTFAGPRAGNAEFASNVAQLIPVYRRVVNFMDVVPQVPVPPLYEHFGQEVAVQGGFRPLDVAYAHHLTTYLAGMQKLGTT
jgi:predicted lipase